MGQAVRCDIDKTKVVENCQ